jgi:hypothetical protein
MQLVLASEELDSLGGAQSYVLTVGEQLERLGHEVTLYASRSGHAAEVAAARGLRVASSPARLPTACDGVLVQDAATAYELTGRYQDAPRIYVAHSSEAVRQCPPQLPGAVSSLVVMNDRMSRFCDSLGYTPATVRLRQPVDLERFGRVRAGGPRPRRAVVFGNQFGGLLYDRIREGCERLGLEVGLLGRHGTITDDPALELARADVVIGIGRCAVEGMASQRAVYVCGVVGTDGWITPDTYPLIESDGFSGRATAEDFDPTRFHDDLRAWTPEMGEWNRDLVYRHHDAAGHAAELVDLWRRTASERPSGPLDELARMARIQGQLESRVVLVEAEAAASRFERDHLRAQLAFLKSTRRYRLAAGVARPVDALRRLLRSRRAARPR